MDEKINKSNEIIYYLNKKYNKYYNYIIPKNPNFKNINIDNNNSNINILEYFKYKNGDLINIDKFKIIINSDNNIIYNNNCNLSSNINVVLNNNNLIINQHFKKKEFIYKINIRLIENTYYNYYLINKNTYYLSDYFKLNIIEKPLINIKIKNINNKIFKYNFYNNEDIILNNIYKYIEYNEKLDLVIDIENASIDT